MGKKWYRFFVVTDEPETPGVLPAGGERQSPVPQRAGDLAPESATPVSPPVVTSPSADLAIVYESAKIVPPAHGYTVLKVAEMLQNELLRGLSPDVRRKSVLVALEAAGVKVEEIVQDAVLRDRALDTYERVLQQHVDDLAARMTAENHKLEEEIARRVTELRAEIDENTRKVTAEQAELAAWRIRKQQEESLIAEAVGHFVSENPITSAPRAAQVQGDADVR